MNWKNAPSIIFFLAFSGNFNHTYKILQCRETRHSSLHTSPGWMKAGPNSQWLHALQEQYTEAFFSKNVARTVLRNCIIVSSSKARAMVQGARANMRLRSYTETTEITDILLLVRVYKNTPLSTLLSDGLYDYCDCLSLR